jgi:hypothetical protein
MDAKLGFAPRPFARGGFACHDPEATHVPKRGEARGVVKKRKAARRGFPTPPGAFRRAREVSSRARFHALGGRATPHVRGRHVVIAGEGPEASRVATASVARPRMIGASRADSDAKIAFRAPSSAPSNRFVAAEKRPANLTLENFFWREPRSKQRVRFSSFFLSPRTYAHLPIRHHALALPRAQDEHGCEEEHTMTTLRKKKHRYLNTHTTSRRRDANARRGRFS